MPKAEVEVGFAVPVLLPEIIMAEAPVAFLDGAAGVAFFGAVGFFIFIIRLF